MKHREVVIGNKSMMLVDNINVPVCAENTLLEVENMARTGILVSIGREVVGVLAVSDPLKPGAREVVSILKNMKVKAVMVTGDNNGTASAIAKEAGIEAVIAEATPAQKAKRVKDFQVPNC